MPDPISPSDLLASSALCGGAGLVTGYLLATLEQWLGWRRNRRPPLRRAHRRGTR